MEDEGYSAEQLLKTFPKRVGTIENARELVKDRVKMFDFLYGGRYGNAPNEGYKYRARGIIGTTFKDNYNYFKVMTGIDVVSNPDLLLEPKNALLSGCLFWKRNKINLLCDRPKSYELVTAKVNGGANEFDKRKLLTIKAQKIFFS